MSIENQARSLLTQHQKVVMNRKRSMLTRAASEIGVDADPNFHNHIQGKIINDIGSTSK
ncbi:hypothetical protein NIES4102_17780 [Chondrocystis sp. NIES-4102]|nr:hypothetical protein NIES4102_17780 [Chondrocystis sp. NIES-4102]